LLCRPSKPITSAVIMGLVEEGKINLNDPVSKYIPQLASMKVASLGADGQPVFEDQVKEMTVEDLLLHRAGMGYGIFGEINAVETAYTKAGLFEPSEGLSVKMDKLGQLPLLTQPGTGWYYSYSIDVLGRIIEVVTEQRLSEALKERVFDPLGMSETAFSVRADQASRFVSNYLIQEDGSFIVIEDGQNSCLGWVMRRALVSAMAVLFKPVLRQSLSLKKGVTLGNGDGAARRAQNSMLIPKIILLPSSCFNSSEAKTQNYMIVGKR